MFTSVEIPSAGVTTHWPHFRYFTGFFLLVLRLSGSLRVRGCSTANFLARVLSSYLPLSFVFSAVFLPGCALVHHPAHQAADDDWTPSVAQPAFPRGAGPIVLVDAAHGNWHTIAGRFKPFSLLLENDGYKVLSADLPLSPGALSDVEIFVVANAVKGGEHSEWVLPTPAAFTDDEVRVVANWVEKGGSLLLIADHMPFPGSVSNLAEAFGIVFLNGFAKKSLNESGTLTFTRSSGSLTDHPITHGRTNTESIPAVKSFTGQAFRPSIALQPLMFAPDDWEVFFPKVAGEFQNDTPKVSARGLLQGAVLEHGKGRVAVFGEAAMFTAQTHARDGQVVRMGLNDPAAAHNSQFVLNVVHWLTGLLDG